MYRQGRFVRWILGLVGLITLALHGCGHSSGRVGPDVQQEEGTRIKGGSVSARIWVLIARGQFAEAEAL
jgi:hypothetical protein